MEELFDQGKDNVTRSDRQLFTPSSFARKHFSYLQEAGRLKSLKPHTSSREDLESFLFLHVRKGSGILTIKEEEYTLRAGDSALVDCRESYGHTSSAEDPWELEWVHFDGSKAEALYPLFLKQNDGKAVFRDTDFDGGIIDRLMALKSLAPFEGELEADCLLGILLKECMKKAGTGEETPKLSRDDYEKLREFINRRAGSINAGEDGLRELCQVLPGYSYEEIAAGFEEYYGISATDYLKNRQLNKAKELLRFTIKPLDEVAGESGIGDLEALRELFLKQEEMSPEDYRKRWAQWIKG